MRREAGVAKPMHDHRASRWSSRTKCSRRRAWQRRHMSDIHDLSALEQRDALRAGSISAVGLLDHYLARIGAHGQALGAFVTLTPELAREEAVLADARLADCADPAMLPPLLGLPLAFKDLHPVAGVRTTMGSAALSEHVPTADAHVVGLLRRAGVVTVGTTHAPEFGPTCYTETDVAERPAVTPYDTTRATRVGAAGGGRCRGRGAVAVRTRQRRGRVDAFAGSGLRSRPRQGDARPDQRRAPVELPELGESGAARTHGGRRRPALRRHGGPARPATCTGCRERPASSTRRGATRIDRYG